MEPRLRVMEASLDESAPTPPSVEVETQHDADPSALQQLTDVLAGPGDARKHQLGTLVRCANCGDWCHFDGRQGPARRRGSVSGQRRSPRLPRASRAPPQPG